MDNAQLFDKWTTKLQEVITQYGPQAADFVLEVGRLSVIKELAWVIFCILFGIGLLVTLIWTVPSTLKSINEDNLLGIFSGSYSMLAGMSGFLNVATNLDNLLDPFLWVGLWRPEVYLAAKALGL